MLAVDEEPKASLILGHAGKSDRHDIVPRASNRCDRITVVGELPTMMGTTEWSALRAGDSIMIIIDFTLGRLDVVILWATPIAKGRRPWWEVRKNNLEAGIGRLEVVASWLAREEKARAAE